MKFTINGDITPWNEDIIHFQNSMKNIEEDEPIEIYTNSYGGDAFLGLEIANTLKAHKGKTTVTVTGIAASAASLYTAAADTIRMYASSQIMVHEPWTVAMGSSSLLRKSANQLDKVGESIIAAYSHRIEPVLAKQLVDDETYLTAKEAKRHGMCDEILDEKIKAVASIAFKDAAEQFNNRHMVETPKNAKALTSDFKELVRMVKNELEESPGEEQENPDEEKTELEKIVERLDAIEKRLDVLESDESSDDEDKEEKDDDAEVAAQNKLKNILF